jgi:hypothetical protein
MTRKNPKARRATALTLLTSLLLVLAAESGALLQPGSAHADTAALTGKRPLPGDPNTPDEGGRTGSNSLSNTKSNVWVVVWIKGILHLTFIAR